jgi:pimeloyl-ACP methyl ester carboxylesterase
LSRPGERQIQSDLFFDYQTNVAKYPSWQAWLKQHHPPLLVLWGKYDPSFALPEAQAYRRDVPNAEIHVLDAGHFALDEKADEAATLIHNFLERQKIEPAHVPPRPWQCKYVRMRSRLIRLAGT